MKIIIRYLLRNKKRISKTILCIAFSVMLMFSLMQMGDVLVKEFHDLALNGLHRDISITRITLSEMEKIQKIAEKQTAAQMYTIWVGDVDLEQRAKAGRILGLEGDLEYFKDCEMIAGRKPEETGEIIVSQSLMESQPDYYKQGNRVELSISDEKNRNHKEAFTVCGVFSNIKDEGDMIFTSVLTADQLRKQWGLSEASDSNAVAVTIHKEEYKADKIADFLYEIREVLYPEESEEKTYFFRDRVLWNEQKSALYEEEGTFTSVSQTLKLLTVIIAAGMMIYIYGVFHINVFQKIRYLGIMRCLGGDQKTLAGNIFGESMLISHAGILFGILGGNVLNRFVADKVLNALMKVDYSVQLRQMWGTYAEVYLVALLPILMATLKVWLGVIRISPVQAMNFEENSKIRKPSHERKQTKQKNIVGYLAGRNIWRNRSQSFTVIAVISVTLTLLLIIANTFSVVDFTPQKGRQDFCRYEIIFDYETEDYFRDRDVEKFRELDGVEEVYSQFIAREVKLQSERDSLLVVYSDSLWEKLLEYNPELKNQDYENKPVSVAYSSDEFDLASSVTLEVEDQEEKIQMPVTQMCVGTQSLLGELTENDDTIKFILNEKMAERIGIVTGQYSSMSLETNSRFDNAHFEEFVKENLKNALIVPLNEESSDENQLLAIIFLASYICIAFFVFVFSMIESMVEFNMINRRSEYGVMRALGMNRRLYKKLICLESIRLGFYAVIIAVIVSLFANYYFTSQIFQQAEFSIPAYIVTVVMLMLLILGKSYRAVHKNMSTSIVAMIQNRE
ncbi:MAG: ABC transporter permease [Eubacterium sp.]|nr:ABC transporter permease [Eubacterium sp.]